MFHVRNSDRRSTNTIQGSKTVREWAILAGLLGIHIRFCSQWSKGRHFTPGNSDESFRFGVMKAKWLADGPNARTGPQHRYSVNLWVAVWIFDGIGLDAPNTAKHSSECIHLTNLAIADNIQLLYECTLLARLLGRGLFFGRCWTEYWCMNSQYSFCSTC